MLTLALVLSSLYRSFLFTLPDPSQLRSLQPWYGRALARYLLATYKLNLYPYSDLIIYEIGAGNGTLMADILDFLAIEAPEVYARTKYRIIEISDRLVGKQKGSVAGGWREEGGMSEGEMGKEKARRRGHGDRVEVIGKSIFEWDRVVHEPCFFIAMEVLVRISFSLSSRTLAGC